MEMITFLKRRFSSGDLQGELADKREHEGFPSFIRFGSTTTTSGQSNQPSQAYQANSTQQQQQQQQQHPYRHQDSQSTYGGSASSQTYSQPTNAQERSQPRATDEQTVGVRMGHGTYPSAPTSPTRTYGGSSAFMGPMGSITGQISNTIMRGFSSAASTAQNITSGKITSTKEKQKVLLVIDDSQTDWGKYFRGRKILGDWEIRVEQAQFSEITMTAYSDQGCVINIYHGSCHLKPARSFKPDFVLIRQHASGANEDWQAVLTGLMYAGTPCMNTLHAVYNMKNRPWLFAHLLLLRNRLGKESFPLITQTYYTSHREMVTAPVFPTIVKIGLGHGGENKIRADNPISFQDITSLLVTGNAYATTEPYVDAKCDLHVQKIGQQYRAFVRKSISGHWKANAGSSVLEKVPMNERFKQWVDEVSRMFGGLDICSVEALQSKTGEYSIYEVNGSDITLFGESQEEARREITELVLQRMQTVCAQNAMTKTSSLQAISRTTEPQRPQSTIPAIQPTSQPPLLTSQPFGMTNQTPIVRPTAPIQPQFPQYTSQTFQPSVTQSTIQNIPSSTQPSYQQPYQQSISHQQQQQQQPSWQSPPGPPYTQPQFGTPTATLGPGMGSVGDRGSASSISSSAGSVTSAFVSPPGGRKMDGMFPSGQSTPQAVPMNEFRPISSTQQQQLFDSNFSPRQSSPSTSVTSSYGGTASSSAWNVTSNSTAISTDFPGKLEESESMSQRPKFHSTSTAVFSSGVTPTEADLRGASVQQDGTTRERPFVPPRQTSLRPGATGEDSDDTMKNLRKTFAGIFGDM